MTDDESAWERHTVAAARSGDRDAFAELYRRHLQRVFALCRRLCGNESEAEEMTQECFVNAWRRLSSFRGDSAFGSWLHRLSVNTVLGSWRAKGRYRQRVVAMGDALDVVEPAAHPRPSERLDLERAIAALPVGARTVFVLHDVEGLKHREIADATGIAEGTSKAQLHRARRLLREQLTSHSSS